MVFESCWHPKGIQSAPVQRAGIVFQAKGITDWCSLEAQQQTILLLLPPALKANKQLLGKSVVDVLLALSSLFSPAKIGCGFDIFPPILAATQASC